LTTSCLIYCKANYIDSLTHIAVGAIVDDALLGKKLSKRAMFLGALVQSIPDVDFISSFWIYELLFLPADISLT
jgi:hypothetical protein